MLYGPILTQSHQHSFQMSCLVMSFTSVNMLWGLSPSKVLACTFLWACLVLLFYNLSLHRYPNFVHMLPSWFSSPISFNSLSTFKTVGIQSMSSKSSVFASSGPVSADHYPFLLKAGHRNIIMWSLEIRFSLPHCCCWLLDKGVAIHFLLLSHTILAKAVFLVGYDHWSLFRYLSGQRFP